MDGWTSEAIATVIAAGIAAVAATVAAVISALNASRLRTFTRREQWWTRFSWALERTTSDRIAERSVGISVLIALIEVPWATPEDNELAYLIANEVSRGEEEGESDDRV